MRQYIDMYGFEQARMAFRPTRSPHNRLAAYGINTHVTCVNVEMCMDPEAASDMHVAIAALNTDMTIAKKRNLLAGRLYLVLRRLTLRGAPPWNQTTGALAKIASRACLSHQPQGNLAPPPADFPLGCPTCSLTMNLAEKKLTRKLRWTAIKCHTCGHQAASSRWTCPCDVPWATCTLHRAPGYLCKPPTRTVAHPRNAHASRSTRRSEPLGLCNRTPPSVVRRARARRPSKVAQAHAGLKRPCPTAHGGSTPPSCPETVGSTEQPNPLLRYMGVPCSDLAVPAAQRIDALLRRVRARTCSADATSSSLGAGEGTSPQVITASQ